MDSKLSSGNEQAALWNGDAGHAWVETQEILDLMFKPIEDMLVRTASRCPVRQVLDVGCGTGSTTLAVSRQLGADGRCIGIDISEPMIATARTRAANTGLPTAFICDDAQQYAFEAASFDLIVSRFGVMFFDDFVQAFSNLRRAARANAELHFYAWRGTKENPFMTVAERTAMPLLPQSLQLPDRQTDKPGQFAFADQHRVRTMLQESGWTAIDIAPVDITCTFPERDLILYLTRMGHLGRVLQRADQETRSRIVDAVRAAFDPYVHGDEVRFVAACWQVSARAAADTADKK